MGNFIDIIEFPLYVHSFFDRTKIKMLLYFSTMANVYFVDGVLTLVTTYFLVMKGKRCT